MVDMDLEGNVEDMLAQLSTALLSAQIMDKAKKEGVSMSELSLISEDGKTKCVNKEEKARSNQLQKQKLIERLRHRCIRGENSLAEDIRNRIERCQDLIKAIHKSSSLEDKTLVTLGRNLESIHNRAASMIKEMEILETAIERKKQEDPLILEVEKASSELFKAIAEKDFVRAAELRFFCEKNMTVYNLRKKRLKPYLTQARQARMKFITEKRRLMRMQFDMLFYLTERLAQELSQGKYATLGGDVIRGMTEDVHALREMRNTAKPFVDSLDRPIANVALSFLPDLEAEIDGIDSTYLKPLDDRLNAAVVRIQDGMKAVAPKKDVAEDIISNIQRMVYQNRSGSGS